MNNLSNSNAFTKSICLAIRHPEGRFADINFKAE
jgi:hypothetical protein